MLNVDLRPKFDFSAFTKKESEISKRVATKSNRNVIEKVENKSEVKFYEMNKFAWWYDTIYLSVQRLMNDESEETIKNHIAYKFKLIKKQKKISYSSNGQYAIINTGLISKYDDEIYIVFRRNDDMKSPWKTCEACCQSKDENNLLCKFSKLPMSATFEEYGDEIFYNINLGNPVLYLGHMSDKDHRERVKWNGSEKSFQNALYDSVEYTMKCIRRCPRLAVPMYYSRLNSVCLALPIAIHSNDIQKPDFAMVVRLNDFRDGYDGVTIIPLSWAYNNARLIEIPESSWLTIENVRRTNILQNFSKCISE